MNACDGLDLVDELRLRCWARENYRSPEERVADWHPVILDEMKRRDAEAALLDDPGLPLTLFSFTRRFDSMYGPHEIAPHFSRQPLRETSETGEMHYF